MSEILAEKAQIGRLMLELKESAGWRHMAAIIEESIESEKERMASGIDDQKDYWIGVGRIKALRSILNRPDRLIEDGKEALELLLQQQSEGES